MAFLIESGELPSAKGKSGYELDRVLSRWNAIAGSRFRDDCQFLIQMIEETDELRLWETAKNGFYTSRDEFLQKVVLIDYDFTEQSLSEIVMRLKAGEKVSLTPAETMARVKPLAKHGEVGNGRSRDSDATSTVGRGTDYLAARIKRDHPEIAEAVERGEYRSIRQAAIAAGIVKSPQPIDTAKRAWTRMSEIERALFIEWINT
jgi:antitoxin (DNA-binding transcriptional repressor) of toxin-antitoxin stability system